MKVFAYSIILFSLVSCSSKYAGIDSENYKSNQSPNRVPSSEGLGSCADSFAASLRLGHNLKPSSWEKENLVSAGAIDSQEYEAFLNSPEWLRVIEGGKRKSSEEHQMGATVLSILKKRYPQATNENLKDRYRVMMHFCS